MVEIEKLEGGAFRVSRVFPNASSMQAGASALERVSAEAFMPVPVIGYAVSPIVGDAVDPTAVRGPTIELRD